MQWEVSFNVVQFHYIVNMRRRLTDFYIFAWIANHLILNVFWSFGFLLGICLIIQIISGIFLAMHYRPQSDINIYIYIMQDVNLGWFIRYLQVNSASFFWSLTTHNIILNLDACIHKSSVAMPEYIHLYSLFFALFVFSCFFFTNIIRFKFNFIIYIYKLIKLFNKQLLKNFFIYIFYFLIGFSTFYCIEKDNFIISFDSFNSFLHFTLINKKIVNTQTLLDIQNFFLYYSTLPVSLKFNFNTYTYKFILNLPQLELIFFKGFLWTDLQNNYYIILGNKIYCCFWHNFIIGCFIGLGVCLIFICLVQDGVSQSTINPTQGLNGGSGPPFSNNTTLPQPPVDFNGVEGSFETKLNITSAMPKIAQALTNISQEPMLLESLSEPVLIGAALTLGSFQAITGNSSLEISLQNVEPVHPILPTPTIGLSSVEVKVDEQAGSTQAPVVDRIIIARSSLINTWYIKANHNINYNKYQTLLDNTSIPLFTNLPSDPGIASLILRISHLDPQKVINFANIVEQNLDWHSSNSINLTWDNDLQLCYDCWFYHYLFLQNK